jgi:hypothetical protein
VTLRHFENKARQSYWQVHIEAWQRSGLTRTKYYRQRRLTKGTLDRWLRYSVGADAARKQPEYQAELRRQCLLTLFRPVEKFVTGSAKVSLQNDVFRETWGKNTISRNWTSS